MRYTCYIDGRSPLCVLLVYFNIKDERENKKVRHRLRSSARDTYYYYCVSTTRSGYASVAESNSGCGGGGGGSSSRYGTDPRVCHLFTVDQHASQTRWHARLGQKIRISIRSRMRTGRYCAIHLPCPRLGVPFIKIVLLLYMKETFLFYLV